MNKSYFDQVEGQVVTNWKKYKTNKFFLVKMYKVIWFYKAFDIKQLQGFKRDRNGRLKLKIV